MGKGGEGGGSVRVIQREGLYLYSRVFEYACYGSVFSTIRSIGKKPPSRIAIYERVEPMCVSVCVSRGECVVCAAYSIRHLQMVHVEGVCHYRTVDLIGIRKSGLLDVLAKTESSGTTHERVQYKQGRRLPRTRTNREMAEQASKIPSYTTPHGHVFARGHIQSRFYSIQDKIKIRTYFEFCF